MEKEKREALENIELIKGLIAQTNREMSYSGGGWISIIWGVFCFVGFGGQMLLNPSGLLRGLYWTVLGTIFFLATYFIIKRSVKTKSQKISKHLVRGFFLFWIPLIALALALSSFCLLLPGLSPKYIPVAILLVISTGFLIVGFIFNREILLMGIIGFAGTTIAAIFFMKYISLFFILVFGVGLIVTGLISNRRWKKHE
jgi:hypothetical protein